MAPAHPNGTDDHAFQLYRHSSSQEHKIGKLLSPDQQYWIIFDMIMPAFPCLHPIPDRCDRF
ncbi:MAG: hypothetical protein WCL00_09175, partial [Bacteroidota bacterium]